MFRSLFSFRGRINRAKMWLFYFSSFLFFLLILFPAAKLEIWLSGLTEPNTAPDWLLTTVADTALAVVLLIWLLAALATIVKRLHDRGKSAAWLALFYGTPLVLLAATDLIGWPPRDVFPGSKIVMFALFAGAAMNNLWYLLEIFFLRGTKGDNRFGPDPLARRSV